uniref:Thymocyte nuclear protein 1 n=1 Tax=Mola mola TaxID=94237 RepID=A0A3Q3WTD0_MOLML
VQARKTRSSHICKNHDLLCFVTTDYCSKNSGKADTSAKQAAGSKRKVSEKSEEGAESHNLTQHRHWLMKSEPESRFENGVDMKFGIEDLKALPGQSSCWDGVRNYQADERRPVGCFLLQIVKEAYVDHTQFDKKDAHFDASSKPDNPKWSMVDVQYQRMMKRFLPLSELKKHHLQHRAHGGPLKDMALFTKTRLSVQPLTAEEFDFLLSLEDKEPL